MMKRLRIAMYVPHSVPPAGRSLTQK
jgi:translation initiation factor 3 subunit J